MYYDEIDQYVDRFYREKEETSNQEVLYGEVIEGDWRAEQIDLIIQQMHTQDHPWENFWNHPSKRSTILMGNQSPQPWEQPGQSQASGKVWVDGNLQTDYRQDEAGWKQYNHQAQYFGIAQQRAMTCAEWAILGGIGVLMVLLLMVIT